MSSSTTDKDSRWSSDPDVPPWTIYHQQTQQPNIQLQSVHNIRQHVNPLCHRFQLPTDLPKQWPNHMYDNASLPLHIDIGCGKGKFLLQLSSQHKHSNYLGLEIRPAIAHHAKKQLSKYHCEGQCDFIGCNVNVDLQRIVHAYTSGKVTMISIQFPDPWFKQRHQKRRVVTKELVMVMMESLEEHGHLFVQTDVNNVFDSMVHVIQQEGGRFLDDLEIQENPFQVMTEREIGVVAKGDPVYRAMWRRNNVSCE